MNVSIFSRLTSRHLDDAALAEVWTNAAADRTASPEHPHLAGCAECRVRYASFDAWMDDLRADALADLDAVFTPERLKAQQAQIFRRIEAAEQPTRIIAFPKSSPAPARPVPFRRWVAAAAAAGLVAGLGLGQVFNLGRLSQQFPTGSADRGLTGRNIIEAPRTTAANPAVVPAMFNEEVALRELDEVATPRYEALRAYDTFTPRAADYIQR